MESENRQSVSSYLTRLAESGRYAFTSQQLEDALGISKDAIRLALHRLRRKGEIASPVRGFHVIIPPEYRRLGCLPADQFIPALMAETKTPYYAGLLSAAQYHGAAHHRPQEFQVMIETPRRPLICGLVRVAFYTHKHITDMPTQALNTPRGTILISTPEATAFDLIGYEARIGGMDAVATILAEMAEKIDPIKLAALAPMVRLPWGQRLGYVLEQIGEPIKASSLKDYVRAHGRNAASLQPSIRQDGYPRNRDWNLIINTDIEAEA